MPSRNVNLTDHYNHFVATECPLCSCLVRQQLAEAVEPQEHFEAQEVEPVVIVAFRGPDVWGSKFRGHRVPGTPYIIHRD